MGESKNNPIALANAVPQRRGVPVMPLGDTGVGLLGIGLEPLLRADGRFAVGIMATGGRMSDLVPMQPIKILLGTVVDLSLEALAAMLSGDPVPMDDVEVKAEVTP